MVTVSNALKWALKALVPSVTIFPEYFQALQSINTLLEKADRVYKTLVAFRPSLEILLLRVYDHGNDKAPTGDPLVDGVLGEFISVKHF